MGEAVVAVTGAAVVGAAAAPLVVSYVLNEEPLDMPPLYPELAPEVAQGGLLVTIPVPDSTTVTSGIPLIPDETLPLISSSSGDLPSQQVLADPLPQENPVTIYTSSRILDQNMSAAGIARPPGSAAHHIVAQGDHRAALSGPYQPLPELG